MPVWMVRTQVTVLLLGSKNKGRGQFMWPLLKQTVTVWSRNALLASRPIHLKLL